MRAPDVLRRLGVFALVLVLVLGSSVAVIGDGSSGTTGPDTPPVDAFDGTAVASVPEETGSIELAGNASGQVVLIDASHGAELDREQLAPITTTLTRNGAEVRILTAQQQRGQQGESPFNASLRSADAFVVIGAEQQYTQAEVNGLEQFARAGGRVLVVKEPPRMQLTSILFLGAERSRPSAPQPLTPLLSRFGVAFGNGYLYNMQEYDTNYRNVYGVPNGDRNLTEGVDRLVFHESTPVQGPSTVIHTTPDTELSETRTQDRYGVVAKSGNLVAVGDSSVMSHDYYRRADNEVFVSNLLTFLVSGEKTPQNAPQPPQTNSTDMPPRRPP